ncbi:MAG TPA: CoA pyrophosphatase [Gemmatimonadaceae bacterium]|nr:CoA pyrophosphatase [Gemmatimonadaceae bacterium]
MTSGTHALDDLLAHPYLQRLVRGLGERPGRVATPDRPVKYAAVAAVARLGAQGDPELLLIRRAERERDPWSGHVAFPGGRMEPSDADLAATAVRETREEIGIDLVASGRLLGTLDDIAPRTPVLPPILVRPFVSAVAPDVVVRPNPEVAGHTWVPFDALLETSNWGTAPIDIRTVGVQDRPVFRYEDFLVWGLTEYMLRQFVRLMREEPRP